MLRALFSFLRNDRPIRRRRIGKNSLSLEELESRLSPSVDILTYHNDLASTGQNRNETILTRSNVNPSTFGQVFAVQVDGQVYAQPLVKTGVNITTGSYQGIHDVV